MRTAPACVAGDWRCSPRAGEGPQRVTIHGREAVVIVAAEDYDRMSGGRTGESLLAVLRNSPWREIDIEAARAAMPVRDVGL